MDSFKKKKISAKLKEESQESKPAKQNQLDKQKAWNQWSIIVNNCTFYIAALET